MGGQGVSTRVATPVRQRPRGNARKAAQLACAVCINLSQIGILSNFTQYTEQNYSIGCAMAIPHRRRILNMLRSIHYSWDRLLGACPYSFLDKETYVWRPFGRPDWPPAHDPFAPWEIGQNKKPTTSKPPVSLVASRPTPHSPIIGSCSSQNACAAEVCAAPVPRTA